MENAHTRLIFQRIVGSIAPLALLIPGGYLSAAILYGADAHEKTFTVTVADAPSHTEDWGALGGDALGVFLSIEDAETSEPLVPEILFLPCIKGSRCVTLSAEEDTPVKGLLSFLRPVHTLSIDGESADALTEAITELCEPKKKGVLTHYRITQEVVREKDTVTTTFSGTCAIDPKSSGSRSPLTFSMRGSIEP